MGELADEIFWEEEAWEAGEVILFVSELDWVEFIGLLVLFEFLLSMRQRVPLT